MALFLGQLKTLPVAVLGASAVFALATGGVSDALLIAGVIGANATIGFLTEHGAERALASLNLAEPARIGVRRGGQDVEIPIEQVVLGDVLLLAPGVHVAADARLVASQRLSVDESSLTGESVPVGKRVAAIGERVLPLAERTNMVYRGTVVTGGSGRAVVVAIGSETELGKVESMLDIVRSPDTPMQRQVEHLSRFTVGLSGAASAAVFGIGLFRGLPALEIAKTAISLAVAAVPEGLPTVAITTLALGLRRMRERNVLVRRLDAVETLGALQVVCLDKTGTITQNRMTVVAAQANGVGFEFTDGAFRFEGPAHSADELQLLHVLLEIACLCSEVEIDVQGGSTTLRGSPTETALVRAALDAGIDVASLRARHPILYIEHRAEGRNIMSSLHAVVNGDGGRQLLAVKGRPAEVLDHCRRLLVRGEVCELDEQARAKIELVNERMASRALRVLGVAYQHRGVTEPMEARDLVWVGLVGLTDPPRPGIAELVRALQRAGIRTVMITGDQSGTAYAIGKQIGIEQHGRPEILDSTKLDEVNAERMRGLAERVQVFSRVSPADKLKIVRALQSSGQVVAMTGDGINDGPALRAADLGIAMGAGGTRTARDVADVVLEDDNLETMIEAVRQGRTIYDDIRKAVRFILATNASEIVVTLAMVAGGMRRILTPMQLLWINLATDIFPELALAVQPPEEDVMARTPRDASAPMFTVRDYRRIILEGAGIAGSALAATLWGARRYGPKPQAATMAFLTLVVAQLLHVVSVGSEQRSVLRNRTFPRNPWMPLALGGGIGLTLLTQLVPSLRRALGSAAIDRLDWLVVAAASCAPFLASDLSKRGPSEAPERLPSFGDRG